MGIIVFIINRTNLNANADAPYTSLYETRQHYPTTKRMYSKSRLIEWELVNAKKHHG